MFLIAATTDSGRTRACVATAVQALEQHREMSRAGLGPAVTDLAGRRRSVASLRGQAKSEIVAVVRERTFGWQ